MDNQTLRNDARVIGLVGLAHGVSHFYHLILAALFPWLKTAFSLSYSQLAFLMTVFFVISGIGQALAGFVVDRVGARRVLFSGMAMLGVSALVLSNAQNYAGLIVGALLAGMGNSIFHPADYTILNQRVSRERLAHGFSVHGISGSLGWAAAPLFLTGVASATDWRTALLSAAALPATVLAILWWNREALRPDPIVPIAASAQPEGSFSFLRLPSVWMCFAFFFLTALALGGIQSFASTGLVKLYGMSLAMATSAFTAYMLAGAVGMMLGGFLGAGRKNHDRTIGAAFAIAAVLALAIGLVAVPAWGALVLMAMVGFFSGIAGPSRDLMIRAAAPKNATGRVYGVVYSGLDSGLAVGPLLFGLMMDAGKPQMVFAAIAFFLMLAIATATGVGSRTRAAGNEVRA
ncbi:MFS transporter [Pseudoduganella eburnea]|uniref:MFS transporter n=1 Tax=Massilia eburnea TaxID=1776165 RepID=A0A6L6QG43_9BURK|nr:MFS transporter [Massilia eburnea]MTW11189.1 MFS transporter [Massilia eburnea]